MFFLSHLKLSIIKLTLHAEVRVHVLVSPVSAGELDRVLHQLAHDGAAELVRELIPLLLLLHPLYHNLVCSLAETLKPESKGVVTL